jgi:hypothetical protein
MFEAEGVILRLQSSCCKRVLSNLLYFVHKHNEIILRGRRPIYKISHHFTMYVANLRNGDRSESLSGKKEDFRNAFPRSAYLPKVCFL